MSDILLTAAQMRALEAAAIESGATTGRALMERAGEGAVDAILTEWPDLLDAPGQAVILCGPGNNGGDGFVVARLLAGRGWAVDLYLHGDPEGLPPDARANHDLWAEIGDVRPLPTVDDDGDPVTAEDIRTVGEAPDLIVDALFGTGLTRPLGPLGAVVAALDLDGLRDDDPAWPRVVALDIPSGLCADSGRVLGDPAVAVAAHLTVAFGYPKRGHLLADAPARCGRLRLVDLDLDGMVSPDIQREIEETSPPPEDVAADFMEPEARDFHRWELLKRAGHKYSHGHAFVLTGGMGRTGAARLAARGALRVGAGLVTLGAPGPAMMECAVQSTALMLRRCADGAALSARLEDGRITSICLGPGLGTDERAEGLVEAAIVSGRACVLDADALTVLAASGDLGLHDRCVATPHGGEFARLCPDLSDRLTAPALSGPAFSRVEAAREAAARAGCVMLLKGPDTIVAGPDGRTAIHSAAYDRAAPWLATAGSGDVLAGMIAGLLARGLAPFEAACAAAWLHVEAARLFGPGLIAEDLPEMLPRVFATLDGPTA